jgi:hypothetical protein
MGQSASSFLGGSFLKAEALKASGPVRGVITSTKVETFEARDGKPAQNSLAIVLDMGQEEKTLTLNKTNLRVLIAAFGDDTDKWEGRTIVAYFDPNVSYGGRMTGGVRVKVPSQKKAAAPKATPAPVVEPESDVENSDDDDSDIPF